MSNVVLMAWSSPASSEVEQEFNSWYDEVHAPQVSELLGVAGKVVRYRLTGTDAAARYVAIYEVGSDLDLEAAGTLLGEAAGSGRLDMTPTMDVSVNPPELMWFESR